jgi:hypothetical protein
MKSKLFLFLFSIIMTACVKKASISFPASKPQLVVTCFISPQDSVIGAVVRLSQPKSGINGSAAPAAAGEIRDAKVIISNGTRSRELSFDEATLFYSISANEFPIKEGEEYFLSVSTPDGKSVSAKTKVPVTGLEIQSCSSSIIKENETKIEANVEMTIKDVPNETTYLSIFYHNVFTPENIEEPFTVFGYFDSDEKINKTTFQHFGNTSFYHQDSLTSALLDISVLNCSKEFYYYNKSVQESGIGSLNPFSDPVMVYTNIDNGYGCFGAYNAIHRSIQLR